MTISTLNENMTYISKVASPALEGDRKFSAFPAGDFFVTLQDFFGADAVAAVSQILFKGAEKLGMTKSQQRLFIAVDKNKPLKSKQQAKILAKLHVGKGYIERLPHSPNNQLIPVPGFDFEKALNSAYGKEAVKKVKETVMRWSGSAFHGMAPFQSRFTAAFENNALLTIEDQKYIENLFRIL